MQLGNKFVNETPWGQLASSPPLPLFVPLTDTTPEDLHRYPIGEVKVAVMASSIVVHDDKVTVWHPFRLHKVASFPFQRSFVHSLLLMLTLVVVQKGFSFFLSLSLFVYIFSLFLSVSFQNNQMHYYWIHFWVSEQLMVSCVKSLCIVSPFLLFYSL